MLNQNTTHAENADAAKAEDSSVKIPLAREELEVSKRTVETGIVRVRKIVHEHEEVIDQPLLREEVEVQRVVINRVMDEPAVVRYEDELLIIPVMEERLLVQKQWVLKEELHVSKRIVGARNQQHVVLRSEEAIVEREHPKESEA